MERWFEDEDRLDDGLFGISSVRTDDGECASSDGAPLVDVLNRLCETVVELKVGEPCEAVDKLLGSEASEAAELSTLLEEEERVRVLSLLAVSRPLLPILPMMLVPVRLLPGLFEDTRFPTFAERESLHDVACCTSTESCECEAPLTLSSLVRLSDDSETEFLRNFFDAPLFPFRSTVLAESNSSTRESLSERLRECGGGTTEDEATGDDEEQVVTVNVEASLPVDGVETGETPLEAVALAGPFLGGGSRTDGTFD